MTATLIDGKAIAARMRAETRAEAERLTEAGLTFHVAPDRMMTNEKGERIGFSATYGRDFFGNVFEIMEIREGAAIRPL